MLTVENVNGKATVWLYTAIAGSYVFQPPVSVSVYTSGWHWDDEQIFAAGPLPGSTGTTMWVREISDGKLFLFHSIEAGLAHPGTSKVQIGSGYTVAVNPLITSVGRADANGNLPLWATDSTGKLRLIPTTTSSTGTTTIGTTKALSSAGWASHELALNGSYVPYNSSAVGLDGVSNSAFDTTTLNTYAYSSTGLANATLDPSVIINDGDASPASWTAGLLDWAGRVQQGVDPAGKTPPFPHLHPAGPMGSPHRQLPGGWSGPPRSIPGTSGPANTISFLGAASTTDTVNGASVSATITYTNGHTQVLTVTFADWTQNVNNTPVNRNLIVASSNHRLVAATGASNATTTYMFSTKDMTLLDNGNPLASNVQIASITLGTNAAVHIFSMSLQLTRPARWPVLSPEGRPAQGGRDTDQPQRRSTARSRMPQLAQRERDVGQLHVSAPGTFTARAASGEYVR